jgi:hypothetical protein
LNGRLHFITSLESFDEQLLDNTYSDALSLYPLDIVNQQLTTPLMRLLGERWKKPETGITEEHFFSRYLRNKLGARIHHMNQRCGRFIRLVKTGSRPARHRTA